MRAEPSTGPAGGQRPSDATGRNAHLTQLANRGAGRHGWLRLTPAYSHRLVAEALERHRGSPPVVLDPFSGSGTTGLVAAERGLTSHLVDINPFLAWFAAAKTRHYTAAELRAATEAGRSMVREAAVDPADLWEPALHRIERWWSAEELAALKVLRHGLDEVGAAGPVADLLRIAFCRTLIEVSNAAFDHQSMSFTATSATAAQGAGVPAAPDLPAAGGPPGPAGGARAWTVWPLALEHVTSSARAPLPGRARVHLGDARDLAASVPEPVDLLYTSPPYANRMSYVRELRPYMYWLGYLTEPADAGELDWRAVGGTWGVATSRVGGWEPTSALPLDEELAVTGAAIRASERRNADLLARYVHKYTEDMWAHFRSAAEVVRPGGRVVYVVGNSSFFGTVVPVQDWYATLLSEAGFRDVEVRVIRKRNSNKALYEYAVEARRP